MNLYIIAREQVGPVFCVTSHGTGAVPWGHHVQPVSKYKPDHGHSCTTQRHLTIGTLHASFSLFKLVTF